MVMIRSSRIVLAIALATLVVLTSSDSAEAQRRKRSNSEGSNNIEENNNPANAGGNNSGESERGNRRNRNRRDDDSDKIQEIQQLFQGGRGGQNNQDGLGNSPQSRLRGRQGAPQRNDAQNVQQLFHDGHNHEHNNRQGRRGHRHNDLERWVIGFNGGPRPFSNDWYRHHPHAWHHHHHDDDYWTFATAASVLGWLGWQNHPHHHHTTIVYDPVPVEPYIVDGQPGVVVDSGTPGEWLALGSYTLLTGADDPGTRILQLSVDKHGHVRGSYFDMITNTTQNVYGVINQSTQQVRWTLETNRQLTFVATLDQLTQPQGVVNVKLPGGQIQQWDLVRMEDAGN
jgi:hypothetical protein